MKHIVFSLIMIFFSTAIAATNNQQLQQEIQRLQQQTTALQSQLAKLNQQMGSQNTTPVQNNTVAKKSRPTNAAKNAVPKPAPTAVVPAAALQPQMQISPRFHTSSVMVHAPDADPEAAEFYPTALVADSHVLTYIAGTPVVSSPYLGSRPAFDGSDYIVNISSINRDIRLMQQRRSLERAYNKIGYPIPQKPILALSGKAEPIGTIGRTYFKKIQGDWNLGSSELDVAAILNDKVEAYLGMAYDATPPSVGGQRVSNSSIDLNMGFVNIGDLDESPFYFTAGQLFVPFGRFSTSMVSATLPMRLARIKARPVILGYKSQKDTGPFAAVYGYRGDTTLGSTGVGGINLGFIANVFKATSEIGVSFVSSMNDATGLQYTGSVPGTTFGGFSSVTNGSENVYKKPGMGAHASTSFDRYNITTEWVSSVGTFNPADLSFNGRGAQPQALQLEAGVTFMTFDRPSSLAGSFQWTKDALALNLPKERISAVFNISVWKDTVESLEFRHDINYSANQFANGANAPGFVNVNTTGSNGYADMLLAQIGVYF